MRPYRRITVVDNARPDINIGVINVGMWFKSFGTKYGPPDVNIGDETACCSLPTGIPSFQCVAIPGTSDQLRGKNVMVSYGSKTSTGPVYDIGPWFSSDTCGPDPYWETGTQPKAEMYQNKTLKSLCGFANDTEINGAIIDVGRSMWTYLGLNNNPIVDWRFA